MKDEEKSKKKSREKSGNKNGSFNELTKDQKVFMQIFLPGKKHVNGSESIK